MSKGIDKTGGSRKDITCHYWYFLKISFRFKQEVCNGCHELIRKAMSFNDAVNNVPVNSFLYMSKDEVMNLLINADQTEKKADHCRT